MNRLLFVVLCFQKDISIMSTRALGIDHMRSYTHLLHFDILEDNSFSKTQLQFLQASAQRYTVITPWTKRQCMKCHWFLCVGYGGLGFEESIFGFGVVACCHWRFVPRSFSAVQVISQSMLTGLLPAEELLIIAFMSPLVSLYLGSSESFNFTPNWNQNWCSGFADYQP